MRVGADKQILERLSHLEAAVSALGAKVRALEGRQTSSQL
jgi:hypothetical protein